MRESAGQLVAASQARDADGIEAAFPRFSAEHFGQSRLRGSSVEHTSDLEIEIRISKRRCRSGHTVTEQGSERRPGLHPLIPDLDRWVFMPRHLTQVVDGRNMSGRR